MKKIIYLNLLVSFLIGTSNLIAKGDQFLGQIKVMSFALEPNGWEQGNGRWLQINQKQY